MSSDAHAAPDHHDSHDHVEGAPAHAFDSPEEVAHAMEHAYQNIYWFIGFLGLILLTVANYYFSASNNYFIILGLAAARSLLIACFMFWLFHTFSLIFRTFLFSLVFLIGMIFLSWWDSTLPHLGNPIAIPGDPSHTNNGLTSVAKPNVP